MHTDIILRIRYPDTQTPNPGPVRRLRASSFYPLRQYFLQAVQIQIGRLRPRRIPPGSLPAWCIFYLEFERDVPGRI
jgi:hypothetical protein